MAILLVFVAVLAVAAGQVHVINEQCFKDCSGETTEVLCGSDKNNYNNKCELGVASCLSRLYNGRSISSKHPGPCTQDELVNPEVYKHCNDLCNEERNHICGSDGVVYDNKCTFTRAQCEAAVRNETLFVVVLSDRCPTARKPDCARYKLDINDLAIEDPLAFRPVCPRVREMVCASDGHSFLHECQMCAYMDANKVDLNILRDNQCGV